MSEKMVKAVVVYLPLDIVDLMSMGPVEVAMDGDILIIANTQKVKARKRMVRKRWLEFAEENQMPNERTLSQLHASLGPDADSLKTIMFVSEVNDCDVPEEHYIPNIFDTGAETLYLDWYSRVKQVIIQNLDEDHYLEYDYDDEVTADNIVQLIPPRQSVTFCRPDVANHIFLTCDDAGEDVSAHAIIVGIKA